MKKLKSQKGIGGTDAIIAVVLIALFSGLIATLSYNIYVANSSLKRMSKATGYITEIFEYVDSIYYDEVTQETLKNYFSDKIEKQEWKNVTINNEENKGYSITLNVTNYSDNNNETTELDLVKTVEVTVNYTLQGKSQEIKMSKVKKRENLITPNKPDLSLIEKTDESNKIYPIKYINNEWKVTNENDATWYSYTNGIWAVVIKTNAEHNVGDTIENISGQSTYIWVPRYAYKNDNSEVKFLYNTTNKYVEQNENNLNKLSQDINENDYIIKANSANGKSITGEWITVNDLASAEIKLNNIYEMKNIPNK